MIKREDFWEIITVIVIAGIIVYFLNEYRTMEEELDTIKDENKKLTLENENLRRLKDEIIKMLEEHDFLSDSIKFQIETLIEEYKSIDKDITTELISATSLIDANEHTKAIQLITKILENILKRVYKKDEANKGKNPRLIDCINYAKEKKLITSDEYYFLNGIREIRNEEAHELAVKKSINIIVSSFLIGIGLIFKLGHLVS